MGPINHLGHLAVGSIIMENTFREQKVHVQKIIQEIHNVFPEPRNYVFYGGENICLR